MSPRHFWTPSQIRALGEQCLLSLREWKDYGKHVTRGVLVELLVLAASWKVGLTGAAKASGYCHESVRKALLANLTDAGQLTKELVRGLQLPVPRSLRKRPVPIAIDYYKRPYYGDRKRTPAVRGGKRQAGTHWFWTYASASILIHGQRWTVAFTPIFHLEAMDAVLERLWQQMAKMGLKIKRILLDREFWGAEVVRWLQHRRVPFIVPLTRRGKFGRTPDKDTGNSRFFHRGMKGFFPYTWEPRRPCADPSPVTVRVACVPHPPRRPLVYMVSQSVGWPLKWIRKTYRLRFGIEASYRQLGQALAVTTTHDDRWRLLLIGIALLLRNLWIICQNAAERPKEITFRLVIEWLRNPEELPITPGFRAKHPAINDFAIWTSRWNY
jgi:hypothetical protein